MAIHTEQEQEVQGFKKEIEESALGMMMDVLQKYQYSYPQKSAIRELVSNCLDAVRERDIALGILSGTLKEEDYFIKRDDALYKDSNFDRKYYDPRWLWASGTSYGDKELFGKKRDTIYITYIDGGETGKDKLLIEDFGVGMGGRRLERYFHMGFSSKRNTKYAIGKFGIGAKAGLAAAPFYTMTTRYNGREYSFNIYPAKILSIMPEWNLETGKRNGLHIFENGARIWYKETTMPNGTTIEIEPKKHHRQVYIDAVKSQLLYFPNIEMRVRNVHGGLDIIPHQAEILYEDELIVLSNNTQFSKPHILIDKINYGNLDFREMELEDRQGNIGIKVISEEVTVNPSREALVWDEHTRGTVVAAFNKVVNIAERIIAKELTEPDFVAWILACSQVRHSYSNGSVLERLSKVVDLSRVAIPFVGDPRLVYNSELFMGLNIRVNHLGEVREGSMVKYRINRIPCGPGSFENTKKVIIQRGNTSFKKDKYILETISPTGFISFRVPFQAEPEEKLPDGTIINPGVTLEQAKIETTGLMQEALAKFDKLKREQLVARMERISQFMIESRGVLVYEDIIVPEDYDASDEVKVEEETASEEATNARKERDKLKREAGVIPIFTMRSALSSYVNGGHKYGTKLWEYQKLEMPVADIDGWNNPEVFYGTEAKIGKDEDGRDIIEAELLHMAAAITRPTNDLVYGLDMNPYLVHTYPQTKNPERATNIAMTDAMKPYQVSPYHAARCHNFVGTPAVKLIKVAQDRRKFFLDFKPIQRFFLDIKGKTLTMSNALVRWNTARVINEQLWKLKFLANYGLFHNHYNVAYQNLMRYVESNYRSLKEHTADNRFYGLRDSSYDDLVRHCDKVTKFQLLVRDNKDNPSLIATAAQELFAPQQEITDGLAIDVQFYDSYMELLEYAAPVLTLLNEVGALTQANKPIPADLESEIRSYLAFKNVATQ